MTTSLYDLTVPALIRGLTAMAAFLEKGRAWAEENGVDPATLTQARLYEDMAPLTSQVQRATDAAKFAAVRLGKIENVKFDDDEATFADLQARIAKTLDFLKAAPREAIDGNEDIDVLLTFPGGEMTFKGLAYAQTFVLPNFYFHLTVAYSLLRHHGVPVGKRDFLGGQ